MTEGGSNQILLLAPNLLGESLAIQLTAAEPQLEVFLEKEKITRHPCLVIWSVDSITMPTAIQLELRRLQEYWKPAPVLLLLPSRIQLKTSEYLQFDCPGLLQDPDLNTLIESIKTLRGGGRVVRLKDHQTDRTPTSQRTMGLGQWLLISGLQQINNEIQRLDFLLDRSPQNTFQEILLFGRKRELNASKNLLYFLWGPVQLSIDFQESSQDTKRSQDIGIGATGFPLQDEFGTSISLNNRDSITVWAAISERLEKSIQGGLINSTGSLLALEALSGSRQKGLLIALLSQLDQVVKKLREANNSINSYKDDWNSLQPELRQQALRSMAGSYVRLYLDDQLTPVSEHLIAISNLSDVDNELPDIQQMLDPLLMNKPLIVEGQLLPPDDPRALIQLEMFVSNWLIRNAELISAEVIGACGQWPELRRYLLNPQLISTRALERLRNQLNSQSQWQELIQRPIQLYESKRLFYQLKQGKIEPTLITEPRDAELRQLGWWQQQVALLVEIRDAISPQLQALVRKIGDLMVIVLTQVIGRAIGLVGRGIAQGMGRSLSRN